MKTLSVFLKMTVLALAVMSGAREARAAFVTYTATTQYPATTANSPFSVTLDGIGYSPVFAGAITLTQTPANNQPTLPQSFTTLCIDFNGQLSQNVPYTYGAPVAFGGQGGLSPTWGANPASTADQQAGIQAAAWIFNQYASYIAPGSTLVQQEEAQLAVWDALYNTAAGQKPTDNTGRFVVTAGLGLTGTTGGSTIGSDLQTILNSVPAVVNPAYTGYLLKPDPTTQYGQETAQEVFAPAINSVLPEPATLLAGALLLLPFGTCGLRRLLKREKTGLDQGAC